MLALLVVLSAAPDYRGPIIDAHAHLRVGEGDGASPTQPIGTKDLRALDAAAGVTQSALIVIARSGDMVRTRTMNDAVISAAKESNGAFFPIASVHPSDGASAMAELDRLAEAGVTVIKLHPNTQSFDVSDAVVADLVARCGDRGMVVLFDAYKPWDASELGKLLLLTAKSPKTKFVLAHMGFSHFRETLAFAQLRKLGTAGANVWFDLSAIATAYAGSPVQAELVWTMRQLGSDRLLFGSDWPVDTPAAALAAVKKLGLTPAEQKRVLHDNAAELFGLTEAAK